MKYFLASLLLVCMSSAAEEQKPEGVVLGSLEMFSEWYALNEEVDLNTVCEKVTGTYNSINQERGYRGQLSVTYPVRTAVRRGTDGTEQRRYFCMLRVIRL